MKFEDKFKISSFFLIFTTIFPDGSVKLSNLESKNKIVKLMKIILAYFQRAYTTFNTPDMENHTEKFIKPFSPEFKKIPEGQNF